MDLMHEAKRRADAIYTKEEEEECESHRKWKKLFIDYFFIQCKYYVFLLDSTCSMTSCSICSDEESCDSEAVKSVSDEPISSSSLVKSAHSSSACPPLPKFISSSEQHLNQKTFYHPPLPALTSHNLRKFNSTTDDNSKNVLSSTNDTQLAADSFDFDSGPSHSHKFRADTPPMTKIHNYPLISGSIPSHIGNQAYLNVTPSTTFKRDQIFPVNSILTNVASGAKKESGEKNKVKFSDTISIAVVPEISRKEKMNIFNDKRKSFSSPDFLVDLVKRELKDSLPLSHPNSEYLKDFLPAVTPEKSSKSEDRKDKPSIKVVNFGIL
jgi:hypothetical protein